MDEYNYELSEPWYLKNFVLIMISVCAILVPIISALLIPLILKKSSNFRRHCEVIKGFSATELEKARTERHSIIKAANDSANKIATDAQNELDQINQKIQDRDAVFAKIVEDATAEANKQLTDQTAQLTTINAEIDKKGFYMNEVSRLKDDIESLEKKLLHAKKRLTI